MKYLTCLLSIAFIWLASAPTTSAMEVVFAVNAASEAYHDPITGINYEADSNTEGGKFPWFQNVQFGGLDRTNENIYRDVRSDPRKFGYDLPVIADGDYALLLHFSDDEGIDRRVFNVVLNEQHTVLADFGVARTCGYRNICNELIYFSVCNGQLKVDNQLSAILGGKIRVDFRRVTFHPLVAAIALIKGTPGEALSVVGTKTVVFFDPKRGKGCTPPGYLVNGFTPDRNQQLFDILQNWFNTMNSSTGEQNCGTDKPMTTPKEELHSINFTHPKKL